MLFWNILLYKLVGLFAKIFSQKVSRLLSNQEKVTLLEVNPRLSLNSTKLHKMKSKVMEMF